MCAPRFCGQCGAAESGGITCSDCFHAVLAFENEHPRAFGAVHHLTVACYYLQHPKGYTREALTVWRVGLTESLDGQATPKDLQRRAGRKFAGATRVRDAAAAPPAWWPKAWSETVWALLRPDEQISVADYVVRARRWAASVRATLTSADTTGAE